MHTGQRSINTAIPQVGGRSLILPNLLPSNPYNALQPASVVPILQVTMLINNNGFMMALATAYVPATSMLRNQGGRVVVTEPSSGA